MKLLLPFEIDDVSLAASNVVEDLPLYDIGTSYGLGDVVRDDTTHHKFESLEAANLGNALTDPAKWLDLGPTNRWAMFDRKLGTVTENPDSIAVTLAVAERVTGLAAFGLLGSTVHIVITDPIEGVVYDEEHDLVDHSNVNDYWDYFFAPILRRTELFVELPPYAGVDIDVTIEGESGTAKCGNLVIGELVELGDTEWGAGFGIIDYSRKEADDFGNVDLLERSFRSTNDLTVSVPRALVDEVGRVLTARRAKPTVFIGTDQFGSFFTYGFARDWRCRIVNQPYGSLTIELESLT